MIPSQTPRETQPDILADDVPPIKVFISSDLLPEIEAAAKRDHELAIGTWLRKVALRAVEAQAAGHPGPTPGPEPHEAAGRKKRHRVYVSEVERAQIEYAVAAAGFTKISRWLRGWIRLVLDQPDLLWGRAPGTVPTRQVSLSTTGKDE